MSGVIEFTDGEDWFIGGWGWRTLMDQVLADVTADAAAAGAARGALANHGLFFDTLDAGRRTEVAAALMHSARRLHAVYANHSSDYERRYAERLDELVALLRRELDAATEVDRSRMD